MKPLCVSLCVAINRKIYINKRIQMLVYALLLPVFSRLDYTRLSQDNQFLHVMLLFFWRHFFVFLCKIYIWIEVPIIYTWLQNMNSIQKCRCRLLDFWLQDKSRSTLGMECACFRAFVLSCFRVRSYFEQVKQDLIPYSNSKSILAISSLFQCYFVHLFSSLASRSGEVNFHFNL